MPRSQPANNLIEFDLASLAELGDGHAFRQVQILLAQAVLDCRSRPLEKGARKMTVQFELAPRVRQEDYGEQGQTRTVLDGITLKIKMDVRCPARQTLDYDCGVTEKNQLVFNPQDAYNHRAVTLPEDDEEAAVAGQVG